MAADTALSWSKKRKGTAVVHVLDGHDRAIVVNFKGVSYHGIGYSSLDAAKWRAEQDKEAKGEIT